MSDKIDQGSGADDKHEAARHMAEAAMRAERAGETDRADDLMEQAERADPAAVIEVVEERTEDPIPSDLSLSEARDAELATMSETVVPGSDAPSRAGISGSGSGADNQGL